MAETIQFGDIRADVVHKDIKNIHLSVYPPAGAVRISAPLRMDLDTIRVFALSKLGWIRKQQKKLRDQPRETPRQYVSRESHYYFGQRCLLRVEEKAAPALIRKAGARIIMRLRPGTATQKRAELLDAWYRQELKAAAAPILERWQRKIGIEPRRVLVQRMKTKWGSCSPKTGIIRLNLELVKKPPECLEYIIVHELVHLIEPTHNDRFIALMDQHMPRWRHCREELNRLPVRHEDWLY